MISLALAQIPNPTRWTINWTRYNADFAERRFTLPRTRPLRTDNTGVYISRKSKIDLHTQTHQLDEKSGPFSIPLALLAGHYKHARTPSIGIPRKMWLLLRLFSKFFHYLADPQRFGYRTERHEKLNCLLLNVLRWEARQKARWEREALRAHMVVSLHFKIVRRHQLVDGLRIVCSLRW